mgnify:CR=1 FL=1
MDNKDVILDKDNETKVVLGSKPTEENKQEAFTKDLSVFFDNLITKGYLTRTVELTKDLSIELKVLDTWETLMADARIPLAFVDGVKDVTNRARMVSELASATVSVNGVNIKQESLTDKENATRVDELYKKYLKLPPSLLDLLRDEYTKLATEQMEFYKKPEKVSEDMENF